MPCPASQADRVAEVRGAALKGRVNGGLEAIAAVLTDASLAVFGDDYRAFGEGGSIPFMGMLGHRFPDAQFVITGALGPGSNAHGPNEFLDLPTARNVICYAPTARHW